MIEVFNTESLETELIRKHGCSGALKPRHVLQTATADLARYNERRRIQRARSAAVEAGADASAWGKAPTTAFLLQHLKNANGVRALLSNALEGVTRGQGMAQPECTRRIYDKPLLAAALELHNAIEKNERQKAREYVGSESRR